MQEGVKLLELAQRSVRLFENQAANEKRKLVDFVLSDCTWKGGETRDPISTTFALLTDAVRLSRAYNRHWCGIWPKLSFGSQHGLEPLLMGSSAVALLLEELGVMHL